MANAHFSEATVDSPGLTEPLAEKLPSFPPPTALQPPITSSPDCLFFFRSQSLPEAGLAWAVENNSIHSQPLVVVHRARPKPWIPGLDFSFEKWWFDLE